MLCLAASWPAAVAQPAQNEKLQQLLASYRTCVRTTAPAAYAEGARTTGAAANYFFSKCASPESGFDLTGVGAMPPGSLRYIVIEEWGEFIGEVPNR